ncbi:thiolase family protein [Amycolatopsis regifaucium]|uniref:Probable acetyl-CoA acetyltransferase n=1 Tax=Amycolatopsis regifaucium TaxID=546365 RepID=A0A154M9M7_9PSEU|nr:thiolase family protein [Amycolatopsis regifaucium]KZB81348.1 beta-ketoadipyl CoA thiolase [Amycolatopsis regifaucium]OKA04613.1 beta-ketoadipyl CoA thiolase [Amycolatopsis regifaucium]SFH33893.1 acetyl-CoA acetyltransferases [Amycolatopsis regifaucium]
MTDVFLFDAIRTPFGKYGGALSGVRPDDLAATVLRALGERNDLDPATVDEVVLGDANGAGEDNRNVARMAALLAGWPTSVPGATVNRLCGSGLDAVMQASRSIQVGDASLAVAGGVESMSRSPLVMQKPEKAFPAGNQTLYSTALGWRMVNPKMPEQWTVSLGESTEQLAERYGIGRDEQDAFAVRSHVNAARAWDEGFYDDHVVAVEGVELTRDEGIRPDSSPEKLAKLKPVFRPQGTVTAANASPLNDGASALLLGDEAAGKRLGKAPLARIAGRGAAGVDPDVFGIGPVRAAEIALERAGIGWEDLAAVELNEAFAAQSLACLRDWSKLDPEIVNVNGGAIAIGHPLGASGGRILGTLAHHLRRSGGRWGLAAICIGVGQGLAVVLEAQ